MPLLEEKISVAPMMEWTDPHFRYLMRGITRKSVLYTEMVVDESILCAPPSAMDFFIGKNIDERPSVIQLGGYEPKMLGDAAARCVEYMGGSYAEINLNCGCPSQRVAQKCFGAQLMLNPDNVGRIMYEIARKSQCEVSVKCRIGVDDQDSYAELKHFIDAVLLRHPVKKFIIHARKVINYLNTKQNRQVPPLCYNVVHQLVSDYPDLLFVLNGGVQSLAEAVQHMDTDYTYMLNKQENKYWNIHGEIGGEIGRESQGEEGALPLPVPLSLPPVHGVMLGRAVYQNPLILSTADSLVYKKRDPCLSRREILERYMQYCDHAQSEEGPKRVNEKMHANSQRKEQRVTCSVLLNAMRNVITNMRHTNKYRQVLNDVYIEEVRKGGGKDVGAGLGVNARRVIEKALEVLDDDDLDAAVGDQDFYAVDV